MGSLVDQPLQRKPYPVRLLTIVIIPVVGLIFGVLADIIMNWIGLDLKHRELAEH